MSARRRSAALRRTFWLIGLAGLGYAALLVWVWTGRTELTVRSEALSETRRVTLFGVNTQQYNPRSAMIYALDGDKMRNGLLPAAHGILIAWVFGEQGPLLIAIHDEGRRDVDFRPARVRPAAWRPTISGRGAAFDVFLLKELRTEIERHSVLAGPRHGLPGRRFLFGHSLGGFYALDMPTRQRQHGFDGIFAFSPTFSHDLSLLDRLQDACTNSRHLYANIGVESGRDTKLFDQVQKLVDGQPTCRGKFTVARHPAMLHQIVMLTGQVAAFWLIYRD